MVVVCEGCWEKKERGWLCVKAVGCMWPLVFFGLGRGLGHRLEVMEALMEEGMAVWCEKPRMMEGVRWI